MKEVKPSKKPLAIYYAIVLLVLLVLNLVFVPWLTERQVKEVDYGTFMSMTAEKQIGRVDIESNQIVFTDKETGRFIKVEGDEESPYYQGRLCARCIALKEAVYHPDRVLYPMKRDPKDRGKADKWERITWDEAYAMIKEKFDTIKKESGAKAVVFHLGTGRGTAPYARPADTIPVRS